MNAYILTRKSRCFIFGSKGHSAQDSPFKQRLYSQYKGCRLACQATLMTKKESIASMANADALTITPETSAGTAPTSTIRNSGENVKKYYADLSAKACVK